MGDIVSSDYDKELCKIFKTKELEQIKKTSVNKFRPIGNFKHRSRDGMIKYYNLTKYNKNT